MSIYKYLIILSLCTFVCWLAWFLVILFIDPYQTGYLAFILFYCSLGFALVGSFSIIGSLSRLVFHRTELAYKQVHVASRQSVFFTLLVLIALGLQSQRYLNWWNLLIMLAVAFALELFFISYNKANKRN